jgi:hypothetical protein
VRQFLENYETERTATRASSRLWVSYVKNQIRETGELKKWNVALVGGNGKTYDVAGINVGTRPRRRDQDIDQGSGYRIKRLVTTRDAGIDLPQRAWDDARRDDPLNRLNGNPRQEPTAFGICLARQKFGINPLLMIYLPASDDLEALTTPVVGVAIGFPGSDKPARETVRYTVNSVFLEEMNSELNNSEDFVDDPA